MPEQEKPRSAPPQHQAPPAARHALMTSSRALAARTATDVIVVTQDAEAIAAMSWKARYEQVLGANERLKERLGAVESAHRKTMTTVKYDPTLPNNNIFTRQLVEENRQLLVKTREMELRLFRFNGQTISATSTPTSTKGSKIAASRAQRKTQSTITVKSCSVQTDTVADSPSKPHGQPSQQVIGLLGDLKARLEELELDLDRLQQENELLRQEQAQRAQPHYHAGSIEDIENRSGNTARRLSSREAKEEELQSSLRDQMRQMELLEARFHQLKERARAKAELYRQAVEKIDELNEQHFDAQQQLVKQKETIQQHEDHTSEAEALRREAHLLRSENSKLNEAIATLSSRPFDELSIDLQKKNLWIGQLEEMNKVLETQLSQAKKDFSVIQQTNLQLRERIKRLQVENQVQAEALETSKFACEHSTMAQEIAELQLRFYTAPGDKTLMRALGKALKDLRFQEDEAFKLTSFMERVDSVKIDGSALSGLCGKCQTTDSPGSNVTSLQKQRLENVSELTQLLKQDTTAQLASLKLIYAQQMQTLKRKLSKSERCASVYLDQIRELQCEKGDLMRYQPGSYDTARVVKNIPSPAVNFSNESFEVDRIVPNPVNIIEIVLLELHLMDLFTSGGRCTGHFVLLCDYYDFESQLSPVIPVLSSNGATAVVPLDFGISYKTCQDASFFKSPIARQLRIELHQLEVGCMKLVAVAELDLNALFLSPLGQCTMTLKLLSPFTNVAMGSIRVDQSLGHPVDAFFKSILRSSRNLLVPSASAFPMMTALVKPTGVVSIRVVSLLLMKSFVSDLRTASSASDLSLPSLVLTYRFVGFPLVKIPVEIPLAATKDGFFIETERLRTFEVDASADFLRFLQNYILELQLQPCREPRVHPDSSLVNGSASVLIAEALRQQSTSDSSTSTLLYAGIYDAKNKDRLLGRISLEISLYGFHTGD